MRVPPHRALHRACAGRPAVQPPLPSQYPLLGVRRGGRGRIHLRPPEWLPILRPCCPPSPCTGLSPARTTTQTRPRPGRIGRHRALPGRQGLGAPEALPTFTVLRLTGSAAGSTPAAHPGSNRSVSAATKPEPPQAWSDPPSSRARSLLRPAHVRQVWGWSANEGASTTGSLSLYLAVSLARAWASGSTTRPSRCRGCSHRWVHDPAPRLPPASPGCCISPGPASQPARIEMSFALTHLLSHSASWRTEEITRDDARSLHSQELAPTWTGAPWCRLQLRLSKQPANAGRRHPEAELRDFAADTPMTPAWILPREAQYQLPNLSRQLRPSALAGRLSPLPAHERLMPAQKRPWSHQEHPRRARQVAGCGC